MPSTLPTTTFGRSGIEVTRLGYGAMEIRGAPRGREVTPRQAETILNAVLDSGINYIDTSIDYGMSEEFIGQFISGRRSEYFLATKCGCQVGAPAAPAGQRSPHIFTRENIVAGVEQSLRRMKTDVLDAVQFHSSPAQSVLEKNGAIEALQDLQSQGKVRFIGISGVLPELEEHVSMGVFDVLQIPYSALERRHENWITRAANNGIGNVIRGGVAKGEPGYSGVSREEAWALFERAGLDELRSNGESRTSFMLRFTLSHPGMHTTIVGTLNPGHLAENVTAAQAGPLDRSSYEEARRRLTAAGEVPSAA
jgi:aryl-alcohol dehydrogenase-like predicted oxidoreductase